MLQLRRIRTYQKDNQTLEYDSNFDPDIMVETHEDLFQNIEKYVERIAEFERFNCHYTLGDAPGGKKRGKGTFIRQSLIPYDIDGIEFSDSKQGNKEILDKFLAAFFEVTGFEREKTVTVFSGNGLHFLVLVDQWDDRDYFKKHFGSYDLSCTKLESRFKELGLVSKGLDRNVFKPNGTLRLPGTLNKKPGKKDRMCQIMGNTRLVKQDAPWPRFTVTKEKKTKKAKDSQAENDTAAILEGCGFLKHAAENQASVNEGQWYAALSIWGRLENGRALCHENSKKHPSYNIDQCNTKIDQALSGESGARTCENISTLWPGCGDCPYSGKVKSPIQIKSEDFIASEHQGFTVWGKRGPQPQHDDLVKYFHREHPYVANYETTQVYVYTGQKYIRYHKNQLRGFAGQHFVPQPNETQILEFCNRVTRKHQIPSGFFNSLSGFINFSNGVLNLSTQKLEKHSPERGFLYVLPYDYSPEATCPEFDSMMKRITMGDSDLEELLLQFVGYSLCDREYHHHKALILVGEGSNGKSTFLDIVKHLVGRENFSALGLKDLSSETSRSMLEGKLVNISDEMPTMKMNDTDNFKKMMGGTITMRRLYQDSSTVNCSTKLMFAANEIPATYDNTKGLYRRLIIAPFEARFDDSNRDFSLMNKIKAELPGIFNRCLAAYQRLLKAGHFSRALRADRELNAYRDDNDFVSTTLGDCFEWTTPAPWNNDDFIFLSDIVTKVGAGAKYDRDFNPRRVARALKRIIPDLNERTCRKWHPNTGRYERAYHGIKAIVYKNGATVDSTRKSAVGSGSGLVDLGTF